MVKLLEMAYPNEVVVFENNRENEKSDCFDPNTATKQNFLIDDFVALYLDANAAVDEVYMSTFFNFLASPKILDAVKFANDHLGIAPLKSFIEYERQLFNRRWTFNEKRFFSDAFDYLYECVYGEYRQKLTWIGDEVTEICTGHCYKKENMNWR